MVTGDREVTTTLTVSEKDASGAQKWSLGKGKLYDVTHLPCRSARYTPGGGSCQPTNDLGAAVSCPTRCIAVLGSGFAQSFQVQKDPTAYELAKHVQAL